MRSQVVRSEPSGWEFKILVAFLLSMQTHSIQTHTDEGSAKQPSAKQTLCELLFEICKRWTGELPLELAGLLGIHQTNPE
jgi:hypothetical protein